MIGSFVKYSFPGLTDIPDVVEGGSFFYESVAVELAVDPITIAVSLCEGEVMSTITLKQKEAKTLKFAITDVDGVVDLSTATLSFMVKRVLSDGDVDALITKEDGDFLRTSPYDDSLGSVGLPISANDLDQTAGTYTGELKTVFSGSSVDKSSNMTFKIESAVHST